MARSHKRQATDWSFGAPSLLGKLVLTSRKDEIADRLPEA
jgi:hypothetical protein